MTDVRAELLRTFLADENAAFAERRAGSFWPRNHYRLSPLAKAAARLLDPDERVDFYFHFMRIEGIAIEVRETEMPLMIAAYRRVLPLLDEGGLIRLAQRHVMLFLFGFDDAGSLPSGETTSSAAMKERIRLIVQIRKYQSMPAQRDKKAKFLPFAGQAPRCLETLRHLGYNHDRKYGGEIYNYTDLDFWGMVLVCLLNRATRTDVASDMMSDRYVLKHPTQHSANLHRSVEAVLPDAYSDEDQFLAMAKRLREHERVRRNATESVALARRLGLPFADDEDWEISIAIPLHGSTDSPLISPNVVRLIVHPNPDWQWEIKAYLKDRGNFMETHERPFSNDLELANLGSGNLHAFPAWLRQLRESNGLDFDIEAADIFVGRKRSAIPLIARWLAT